MSADSITLGRVLGEGASAVVYEATDLQGRTVCVKQFKSSIKLEDVDRMHRETEVLKRLNHPKIPRIIDVYEEDVGGRRLLHVVQDMVDGEDLQSWCAENLSTLAEIQQMLAEILEILVYLHRHQPPVLHRDIKPSNLMRRLDGSIVLIDFGQAIRDVHRTFGQTMVTGTLGYQALEQIIGDATPKSDVYSVGVVAVELLTGLKAHTLLEGPVLRWEAACAELPLPVQEWLDRMLHQDIHQRFNAAEGLEALTDIADVFVDGGSISVIDFDSSEASAEFLELLEDAIDDETEEKRAERARLQQAKLEQERMESEAREADYRAQVERDRAEGVWIEVEEELWSEMSASLEQLNRAIEADRVSIDKGMSVFREAFAERVAAVTKTREWGEVDACILKCWEIFDAEISSKMLRYQRKLAWTSISEKELSRTLNSLCTHLGFDMLYSEGRLLRVPYFSLSWVGSKEWNNDALNRVFTLLSQQFLHSNDIKDVLYSQVHSDYHSLIVHALTWYPETRQRWGEYWFELASRPRSEESRKEVRFLLHTLVCSAPNDFPIQPGHIVQLCWFDETRMQKVPSNRRRKDKSTPHTTYRDKLQNVEKFHQRLSAVPDLTIDAQRGLQWLKHLVLTPKLWSLNDNLWHPDFSKTGCALAFNDRTLDDFDTNTLQMYRQYILFNQEMALDDALSFTSSFIDRYDALPTSPEELTNVLNQLLSRTTYTRDRSGPGRQANESILFPWKKNYISKNRNELRGAPSHLERFEFLMANWETLNGEDGKGYGWTTNQTLAETLGLLVEVMSLGTIILASFAIVMNYMETWTGYLVPIITNELLVQTGIVVIWLVLVGAVVSMLLNYVSIPAAYFQQTTWRISTEVGRNARSSEDLENIISVSPEVHRCLSQIYPYVGLSLPMRWFNRVSNTLRISSASEDDSE